MKDKSIFLGESQNRVDDIAENILFHDEITDTPAAFDAFNRAKALNIITKSYRLKLESSSKPFTVAGVDIKIVASRKFSIVAKTMSSYGVKNSISELKGLKTAYTYSKLFKKPYLALHTSCSSILNLISGNAAGLVGYKIDANLTDELTALVNQLETVTKLPQNVIKQHANDNIEYETHEKKVIKFFDEEFDTFMEIYQLSNMSLFLAYTAARRVRHHHLKRKSKDVDPETITGILELMVLYKSSMEPVFGANFAVVSLSISETTDEDGEIYIDMLAPGTYQGKLMLDDMKTIEFEFVILAGKTTALQFLMEVESV